MYRTVLVKLLLVAIAFHACAGYHDAIQCKPTLSNFKKAVLQCLCEPCYLCESKWSWKEMKYECFPKEDLNLTDDGSLTEPRQPEFDPEDWFLTEKEMTDSRGGVKRNGLELFTDGNVVTGYIDGGSMIEAIYEDIKKTGRGAEKDFVYHTGWCSNDLVFQPYNKEENTTFRAIWKDTAQRGVDLLTLLWQNVGKYPRQITEAPYVNGELQKYVPEGTKVAMVLDDRLGSIIASHHQKTTMVHRDGEMVAYVGGIDFCFSRYDTWRHKYKKKFVQQMLVSPDKEGNEGWVDEGQKIRGPAAMDVLENFVQRWTDPVEPKLFGNIRKYSKSPKDLPKLPNYILTDTKVGKSVGSLSIQIARTFSCKAKAYKQFAPRGEYSLFQARLKAIRTAKNYIYIIDQYFIYQQELLDALVEALPKIQKLIIFTRDIGPEFLNLGYDKFQFEQIEILRKLRPNKVHVYTTNNPNVYVHSKTVIIDDMFLAVGSANWNQRSMGADSEMAAHVVDRDCVATPDGIYAGKYVRNFRLRKWAEMAGVSPKEIKDLTTVQLINWMDQRAEHPRALVKRLETDKKPGYNILGRRYQALTDPFQTCDDDDKDAFKDCHNSEWLESQPKTAKLICKCIENGFQPDPASCPFLQDITYANSMAAVYHQAELRNATCFIVLFSIGGICIFAMILLAYRKRQSTKSSTMLHDKLLH